MPTDAYEPCPCGSGKKFKFCCSAATEEIDKVQRYQESHQTQSSLQVLDRLISTKPKLGWAYITKASILLNEGDYTSAREVLMPFLEKSPDHPFGIALYATAAFASAGYEAAKPAIYRAFQRCNSAFPDVVGSLSMGIAAWMFSRQKYMGCRQHLAQAMRLVPDNDKQDIFVRLLEFDSNGNLPYPLRSVHQLVPYTPTEGLADGLKDEIEKLVHRAEALVAIGCFEPAADGYRHLAERDSENAGLWQNAGLCAAWDGNEAKAAEHLHRAAARHSDPEIAVECAALAQLLQDAQPKHTGEADNVSYRVSSIARLLTLLDEHDRIVRMPDMPTRAGEPAPETITYSILDRDPLPDESDLDPALEDIPCVIAQLEIDEQAEGDEPQAYLGGLDGQSVNTARKLIDSVAGEVIESSESDNSPEAQIAAGELAPLLFTWHFPPKMPVIKQSKLEDEQWAKNVAEVWPTLPLAGLGGKSPAEAKGNSDLDIPLRAAIQVLDAFCDRNGHLIDVPQLCEEMGVPAPTPIETQPDLPLQSYSAMQLHRLKISELSDDQLVYVLNRMLLIHHGKFLREVLQEALSRPGCAEKVDRERTYNTLAELARDRNDREDALHWIKEGQELAKTLDQPFEKSLRWEMRELAYRAENPADPELMPHVQNLVRKYAKKLPNMLEYVHSLLTAYGIEPPANLAEMAEEAGSVSGGGIWTPGEQPAPDEEKKLWLPGS